MIDDFRGLDMIDKWTYGTHDGCTSSLDDASAIDVNPLRTRSGSHVASRLHGTEMQIKADPNDGLIREEYEDLDDFPIIPTCFPPVGTLIMILKQKHRQY